MYFYSLLPRIDEGNKIKQQDKTKQKIIVTIKRWGGGKGRKEKKDTCKFFSEAAVNSARCLSTLLMSANVAGIPTSKVYWSASKLYWSAHYGDS